MANIYLHLLDEAVNEKCRVPSGYTPCTVRYADGLVILCNPGEAKVSKKGWNASTSFSAIDAVERPAARAGQRDESVQARLLLASDSQV